MRRCSHWDHVSYAMANMISPWMYRFMDYVPIIHDFFGFSFCLVLQVKLMAWQMTKNLINIKNTLLVYKMCITARIININKGIQLICEGVGEWAVKWCQLPSMLSFPDNLEQHVTSTDTQMRIDIYKQKMTKAHPKNQTTNKWQSRAPWIWSWHLSEW